LREYNLNAHPRSRQNGPGPGVTAAVAIERLV